MPSQRPPDPALVEMSERLVEAWRATAPADEPTPTTLATLATGAGLTEATPSTLLAAAKLPPFKDRAGLPPKTKIGLDVELKWKPTKAEAAERKEREAKELPAKLCRLMIDAIAARNRDRGDAPARKELEDHAKRLGPPGLKAATIAAAFKLPEFREKVAATAWNRAGDPGSKARVVLRAATGDDAVIGGLVRSILVERAAGTTPTLDAPALTKAGGDDLGPTIAALLDRVHRGHRRIEGVYFLPIKGKALYCAAEAVRPPLTLATGAQTVPIPPSTPPRPMPQTEPEAEPFEPSFHAAFDRVNFRNGGTNLVKLHDLRRELPHVPRERFDQDLRRLREADLYYLQGHDGRHGVLTQDERSAGIEERGSHYVYVLKKRGG